MFGAADIVEEKANIDEYESGSTEEKVMWFVVALVYFVRHL